MATTIQMPKLGLTMQEGKIAEWMASDGQRVTPGEILMLIETDKVEYELEAEAAGIVHRLGGAGDVFECGEVIGWLLADGEDPPAGAAPAPAAAPADTVPAPAPPVAATAAPAAARNGRLFASPNARRVAKALGVDLAAVAGTGPNGRIVSEDVEAAAASAPARSLPAAAAPVGAGGDRFVPFAAAAAAAKLGVDLAAVRGTGPDGRVSRADVYAHARTVGAARPAAGVAPAGPQPGDRLRVTAMRRVIADRMHTSLQQTAQLTLAMDVDMGRCVALRDQLKELGADELGTVPGFTDFVIAATARALRRHPLVNASLAGDAIEVHTDVNVGMAVAVEDGLLVPVVKAADQLGLVDLAGETSRLARAARDRKLALAELEGATFAVTALGMYGVDMFTPIINAPNAAILGVGRIRDDVAWDGDRPVKARVMTLSLTWDHRVIDGAPAAEFTATVKSLLEQPLRLLG